MRNLLSHIRNSVWVRCGLLVLTLTTQASAQTRMSLTEALETGVKNRHDLQASQLSEALSANATQKNRNGWLPDIVASFATTLNCKRR